MTAMFSAFQSLPKPNDTSLFEISGFVTPHKSHKWVSYTKSTRAPVCSLLSGGGGYRLIVGAQLERVIQAVGCVWPEFPLWIGWHHKTWCQWMVRDDYRGRHSKKDGARVSSWKQEEWKWMKDDLGVYSKYLRQQMKTIWTLSLQFFDKEHILTVKKKIEMIRSADTVE